MGKDLTPLMRQYWDVKTVHPDKIILFRMGDFFEMFHDDAKTAAPILGITLTSRNKKAMDETPMCGVPHHSIAGICNKLLKAGYKVAICDQIEDPKLAKGLVKRGVTRILTPGMVYDSENLNPDLPNYIASFFGKSLSFVDVSSGEAFYFLVETENEALQLLHIFPVAELISSTSNPAMRGEWMSTEFNQPGEPDPNVLESVFQLTAYVKSLGGEETLRILRPFELRSHKSCMSVSPTVLRHLEIFNTYGGEKNGSFLQAIDRTRSSSGARLLRQWVSFPLINIDEIKNRQDKIEHWSQRLPDLKKIRELLIKLGDIERRLGRITTPQAGSRDLQALAQSLLIAGAVAEMAKLTPEKSLVDLALEFESTFQDELPVAIRQGGMIRKGVEAKLDEWIELSTNTQGLLHKMEEEERAQTGISSLKIRYNNVFGYYIEVTHTHKEKIPDRYLRKQTLVNAERFCTPELIELEKKVLNAEGRRAELEYEIFVKFREDFLRKSREILQFAEVIAELDVMTSLAWLAVEQSLVRPVLGGKTIELKASRHTVVEQVVGKHFVANDIYLDDGACLLLTGPNMAGKSTLMRQVALISLMAQMGSFVPATSAKLPVFDAIYTRIGASDMLSEGLSTFMVEMKETAQMLSMMTEKSLVILDEVGRGTSTYDGMAIAQSLLEELVSSRKCITLFATHYHELTALIETYPQIKNGHMSVVEKNGEILFLHSLKSGPAGKSYGIQVGRLAGLPSAVTDRADKILRSLEEKSVTANAAKKARVVSQEQLPLIDYSSHQPEWIEKIKSFDVSQKTPLEALVQISCWQNEIQ
jgi:DNA mismatch repair protein MutS